MTNSEAMTLTYPEGSFVVVRRTYLPALWLQYTSSPSQTNIHFKVNRIQVGGVAFVVEVGVSMCHNLLIRDEEHPEKYLKIKIFTHAKFRFVYSAIECILIIISTSTYILYIANFVRYTEYDLEILHSPNLLMFRSITS